MTMTMTNHMETNTDAYDEDNSTGSVSNTNSGNGGNGGSSDSEGRNDSPSSGQKRPIAADGTDDKKAERRAANRRSAFQSRQRRKVLIEDLQRTVAVLSKDNNDLRKLNDEMRVQLDTTVVENQKLRMHRHDGAPGGAAGLFNGAAPNAAAQNNSPLQQQQTQVHNQAAAASASALLHPNNGSAPPSIPNAVAVAMAQLLGAPGLRAMGTASTNDSSASGNNAGAENDQLLQAQLALAAAQQSQQQQQQHAQNKPQPTGLEGLQALLQNAQATDMSNSSLTHAGAKSTDTTADASVASINGSSSSTNNATHNPSNEGMSDIHRALLQTLTGAGMLPQQHQQHQQQNMPMGNGSMAASNQPTNVTDALRSFFQHNNNQKV